MPIPGSKANVQRSGEVEAVPLGRLETEWLDPALMPSAPTTIDPRMVQFSGPTVDSTLASKNNQNRARSLDQESALTELHSEIESEDLDSAPEAAKPTVGNAVSGVQKLGALNGGSENEKEEEEEDEEDELKRDDTWSATKKTRTSKTNPIEGGAMLSKPSDKAKAGKAKSKAGKAKVQVKESEKFSYAPTREPDISNVRIVYHVPDDSDDELVSKVTPGKLYKSGVPTVLHRIGPMEATVPYTYLASSKTVSHLFQNSHTNSNQYSLLYLVQVGLSSLQINR